jgi:hypothetical protein
MLHQVFEQSELAGLQRDLLAAANDPMRQPVELEVGDPILGFSPRPVCRRASTSTRAGARKTNRAWADIVAAGAQPADPVVDRAEGGQNERRGRVAFRPQPAITGGRPAAGMRSTMRTS